MPEKVHDSVDVLVVGGGPAGLMAAACAAKNAARTLLVERMDHPGRKLSITGHGRGNIGNTAPLEDFLRQFGPAWRFLRPALLNFFTSDMQQLFAAFEVPTHVEEGGRIFPDSQRAVDCARALERYVLTHGVLLCRAHRVTRITRQQGSEGGFCVFSGEKFWHAQTVILCTGGASYPATGSSGDGYALAHSLGHSIVPPAPALVGLCCQETWARRLQGTRIADGVLSLWTDGKKVTQRRGDILFTHFGLSGPAVLNISRTVLQNFRAGQAEIRLDFLPDLSPEELDVRFCQELSRHGKKSVRGIVRRFLPGACVDLCLEQCALLGELPAHQLASAKRRAVCRWCKELQLTVYGSRPLAQATVTAGGVPLKEVLPKTLESRCCPGLFFAGELLDYDGPSGGFHLQVAFSTGVLAGKSAAQKNKKKN